MDNESHMNDDSLLEDAEVSGELSVSEEMPASSEKQADAAAAFVPGDDSGLDIQSEEQTTVQSESEPESGSASEDESQPECESVPEDEPALESESQPECESETEDESAPESKSVPADFHDEKPDEKPDEKEENKKSSKAIWMTVFALAAVIIVIEVAFVCTHAVLGNIFGKHEIYYSSTTEINLSGSDYKDYSQLSKVKSLEVIDLTNSSFSDLSDLYGCKKLQKVILTGKEMDAQDCVAFFQEVPGAQLVCKVKINDQVYDSDITQLKAESVDEKTQRLFAALVSLESLDMTACDVNDDTYQFLSDALKNCTIVIRTVISDTEYITTADSVSLIGEISDRDAKRLRYFSHLKLIDLKNCTNSDKINDFLAANPDLRVNRPVELLGKIVGTEDELADLRGSKYTLAQVKEALDEKLPALKSLKKIDMCGCGLSNTEMEQLCKAYPEIKFVWMVHFKRWSVRTDAVVFSTLNGDGYEFYDQNDYAPVFKYCTDLIALDLGHSLIYDISPIASMKNLRAVILTDNKIHNITAFSNLKDLEFIEINVNRVESAEPLRNLQKLKYIDFWSSKAMTNLEPLYNHKELQLAIFHRTVSQAERSRFMKSNPNCDTYFKVDTVKTTTNRAWRKNPYRKKLKVAFKNWKYVVGFDEKTGKYIFDYDTDQYSIM